MRRTGLWTGAGLVAGLGLATLACGGGETAIVGFGNHDNHLRTDSFEELGETLAELEATPEVTDEMIGEIFAVILDRARGGDMQAARVVLAVAEEQREDD